MTAITSKGRPQLAGQQQAVLPPNPTKEDILNALVAGKFDTEQAAKELGKLDKPARSITLKVSAEKKCLSVYGLQRMPITHYVEQWEAVLDAADEMRQFIADHPELARKQR